MSCKPTYNGNRFNSLAAIKKYIETANSEDLSKFMAKGLSPEQQIRISKSINRRSVTTTELLKKYDPMIILELSDHLACEFSRTLDRLEARIPNKTRRDFIKELGVRKIFEIVTRDIIKDFTNLLEQDTRTSTEESNMRELLNLVGSLENEDLQIMRDMLIELKNKNLPIKEYTAKYESIITTFLKHPSDIINDETSTLTQLFFLSSYTLIHTEKIAIGSSLQELSTVDENNYEESIFDLDEEYNHEESTHESYQVNKDEVSSYAKLPESLRRLFSKIDALQDDGSGNQSVYRNILGRSVKLNPAHVYAVLVNNLVGVPSVKEMKNIIKGLSSYN